MTNEPLFERQRAALRLLQLAVRERAASEQSIAQSYQAAMASAETEVAKVRRSLTAQRKKALEEIEAEHASNSAAITEKYDALQHTAEQQRFDLRKKMVDEYSAALEKKRTEYKDRLWTVDSILEAGEKEAEDRFQELRRKAASGKQHAESLWSQAEQVLQRVGLERTPFASLAAGETEDAGETADPLEKLQQCQNELEDALKRMKSASTLRFLSVGGTITLILVTSIITCGIGFAILDWPINLAFGLAGGLLGGGIVRIVAGILAKNQIRSLATAFATQQAKFSHRIAELQRYAEATRTRELAELRAKHAADRQATDEKYQPKLVEIEQKLEATLNKIEAEYTRVSDKVRSGRETDTRKETERYEQLKTSTLARLDAELAAAEQRFADKSSQASQARDSAWQEMATLWQNRLQEIRTVFHDLTRYAENHFPDWTVMANPDWKFPTEAPTGIRYGQLQVDLYELPEGIPTDVRLNPPEPFKFNLPAFLPFSQNCSVLFKARDQGRVATISILQAVTLRFLTGLPPAKVRFTIIDPVGLGENFAAFMHLADFDEKLVTSRIWTEPGHIEKRLADLTEHMENVIQKYLRNQYKSIEEYNAAAGEVAEPYRVLIIANFPTNFTPEAARRLVSIMSSGPACGVCTIVGVDLGYPMPREFNLADLEQVALNFRWDENRFVIEDPDLTIFPLTVESPPDPHEVASLVNRAGQASLNAARVEVPFEFIMPPPDKVWTGSTARGFDVPIGRAGATGRQVFSLGRGTAQHALVAGKTGSGKSTLLHALITNLALNYSPEEAELYLIDFKKGVEFKTYAEHMLPHARVIAIESEREFGLSVLQRLDGILRERGEQFRQLGVNDLPSFREAQPGVPCPRILLVVDEFQEFFVDDDKLAQECALLMDRLVRQGRAFGVHLLLGSQTLGGAFSLARSTIDQMAVRIALQCSEADAQLILSKDNTAARLLNRPGDAIYNDANGLVEGNDPFQVVWLGDEKKEQILSELRKRADASGKTYPPPLVFEGSASADMTQTEPLVRLINTPASELPAGPPTLYLGDPVAIKDPTVAVFRPQSGANLLLIGQHEESALALMTSSVISIAARLRQPNQPGDRILTILDGTPDDSEYADQLRITATTLGRPDAVVSRADLGKALAELSQELNRRQSGEVTVRSPRFLLVHGLHRLRELRKVEEEFSFGRKAEKTVSPGELFVTLLREGPPLGIHCIVWCDSLTNLQRSLDRQALREFVLRVLFQMSASDSSHLLDSPIASRLGRSRALFVEEGSEQPEKFRPYGLPPLSWLQEVGSKLRVAASVPANADPSPRTAAETSPRSTDDSPTVPPDSAEAPATTAVKLNHVPEVLPAVAEVDSRAGADGQYPANGATDGEPQTPQASSELFPGSHSSESAR